MSAAVLVIFSSLLAIQWGEAATDLQEVQFLQTFFETNNGTQWLWKSESTYGPQWNFSQAISLINPCGDGWQGLVCSATAVVCSDVGQTCHISEIDLSLYEITGPLPTDFDALSQLTKLNFEMNFITGTISETLYTMDTLHNIQLGSNYLHGSISSKIGQLTNLEVFECELNLLSQSLPVEIGDVMTLKSLVLYDNFMTGVVPAELGNCVHLLRLDLEANLFHGGLADDMFALTSKLTFLDLSDNMLSGPLPSTTQNLVSLTDLWLRNQFFSGPLPVNMQSLTSLTAVWIDSNLFNGTLPSSLGELTNLDELLVYSNLFTGTLPNELGQLTNLKYLTINSNNLMGTLPASLGNLRHLELFWTSQNSFEGSIPFEYGKLVNLIKLDLSNNQLDGTIPTSLSTASKLQRLTLSENHLTGGLADDMFALTTQLMFLDLSDNMLSGPLPSTTQNLVSLTDLWLRNQFFSGPLPVNMQSLTSLTAVWIDSNLFNGTLPSSLGELTNLDELLVYSNLFTGTLPNELGQCTNLKYLATNNNNLMGTLPASLGNLTQLELFWTSRNSFEGSIPFEYGKLVNLISLIMNNNLHSGVIPSSFGNCVRMDEFKLHDMGSGDSEAGAVRGTGLSGSIPSELGNMILVKTVILTGNQFTHSIPFSLGLLPNLVELDLSYNQLDGSIPIALGNGSKLERLALNANYLTGTLPPMHVPSLINFFAQGNKLRGRVRETFWDPHDVGLTHVDMSDNFFSGEIPTEVFRMPNMSSLALSGNCFSGYLPEELCLAKTMQVLSLNGLGAARGCKDAAKSFFSDDVVLYNTMKGSLPECVWHLPELLILHATGNGLTGYIPELKNYSKLQNIGLAHNYITGTIPRSLQERQELINLDLSYNALRGGFSFGVLNISANVSLEINRLSGKLHPSNLVTSGDVNILRGNLFSCGTNTLPQNDEDADLYRCGSEDLDVALYSFLTMGGVLILTILLTLCFAYVWFKQQTGPADSAFTFSFDFKETSLLRRMSTLARNHNFYATYLQTLESSIGSLLRIFCFDKEMYFVSRSLKILALMSIVIPFPVMILKFLDHATNEGNVMTHSHLYMWLFSLAYLTGEHTAILLMAVWFIMVVIFSIILLRLQQQAYAEEEKIRDSVVTDVCRPSIASTHSVMEGKEWRMIGLVGLNLLIVGSVNWLYISLLSGNTLTPLMVQVLQISLAVFKMMYSIFCVPMLCVSIKDYKKSIWVRIRIYVLNSIIVPTLVAMRTSPNCILGLFDSADPVGSVYTYQDCVSVVYTVDTGITECTLYSHTEVEVAALVPPFLYQYQCSSVVLTSYIPVFIYSYMFQLMLPFGVFLVSCIPYSRIPKIIRTKFPGIFWPDFWVSNGADRLTFGEGEAVDADVAGVATGRRLFNIKTIVGQMMHHICVLLTFGLCSPLLALVVICCIVVTSDLLRVCISRFVHYRVTLLQDEGKRSGLLGQQEQGHEGRAGGESTRIHMSSRSSTAGLENFDFAITALSEEFKGTADMLLVCHLPILLTSCLFFTMLCFDMSGDDVGWKQSMWVPIVFVCLFLLVLVICKYVRKHFVVKPILDTGLYSVYDGSGDNSSGHINNPLSVVETGGREGRGGGSGAVEMLGGDAIHNPVRRKETP